MRLDKFEVELPYTRISCDKNYVANVGLATYVFAGYEGILCEVIDFFVKDFRHYVAREKALTSGAIREKLLIVLQDRDTQYCGVEKRELEEVHDTFFDLIERRNALIHGRPATAPDGESQVLNYQAFKRGQAQDFLWQLEEVRRFVIDTADADHVVDEIRMRLMSGSPVAARELRFFSKAPFPNGRVRPDRPVDGSPVGPM